PPSRFPRRAPSEPSYALSASLRISRACHNPSSFDCGFVRSTKADRSGSATLLIPCTAKCNTSKSPSGSDFSFSSVASGPTRTMLRGPASLAIEVTSSWAAGLAAVCELLPQPRRIPALECQRDETTPETHEEHLAHPTAKP